MPHIPESICVQIRSTFEYWVLDLDLVVYTTTGHWPLSRPVISTEQSKGQMQSVEIPLYQTGKVSAPAFQIGEAQDQQTKSAEAVRWRISAVESHSTDSMDCPYRSGQFSL